MKSDRLFNIFIVLLLIFVLFMGSLFIYTIVQLYNFSKCDKANFEYNWCEKYKDY